MTRHHKVQGEPSWTKHLEELAAKIVAAESGVQVLPHDIPGAGSRLADFTLHGLRGECLGVLEVTSVTAQDLNDTWASLNKRLLQRLPDSRFTWSIAVKGSKVHVTALGRQLAKALGELEESVFANVFDHDTFYVEPVGVQVNTDNGIERSLNEQLYRLGVHSISVNTNVEPELPGYVYANVMLVMPPVQKDAVTTAVNHELAKDDNLTKLRKAGKAQRAELFIWLDSPHLRIAAFHPLPKDTIDIEKVVGQPILPEGVTSVWVAPTPIAEDNGQYWYSNGGPWKSRPWTVQPKSVVAFAADA